MQEPTFPYTTDDPDPWQPPVLWFDRGKDEYQRCLWYPCGEDSTDRYPLPLCQRHALWIWSLVDEDIRESGRDGHADLKRMDGEWVKSVVASEPKPKERDGYVYVLEVGGMIKIGYTANPFRRGGQYPPSAELLAMFPGRLSDEKELHERFSAYREAGREWYLDCREIREYVAELNAASLRWEKAMFRKRKRSDQAVRGVRERGYRV